MPVTKTTDLVQAARTGLQTNPTDPKIRELLLGLRRQARDPADKADDLARALAYLNQSVAVVNAAGLQPLNEHLAVIAEHYPGLAEDVAGGVIDRKKVRNRARSLMTDAATTQAIKDRLQDFVRRDPVSDRKATDPIETVFAAALAEVRVPTSEAALTAAIATLEANRYLMEPPPTAP